MVGDYGGHQPGLTVGILRRNLTNSTITVLQAGLYDQSDNAAMIILIEILHWGLGGYPGLITVLSAPEKLTQTMMMGTISPSDFMFIFLDKQTTTNSSIEY